MVTPLGPSITSSRETPTPLEPPKWTPISPSLSKSKTSAAHVQRRMLASGQKWQEGIGVALTIEQAIHPELATLLADFSEEKLDDRRARLVRHGDLPEGEVLPCPTEDRAALLTPAYPAELRERGVRLFRDHRGEYASDNAAYPRIIQRKPMWLVPSARCCAWRAAGR